MAPLTQRSSFFQRDSLHDKARIGSRYGQSLQGKEPQSRKRVARTHAKGPFGPPARLQKSRFWSYWHAFVGQQQSSHRARKSDGRHLRSGTFIALEEARTREVRFRSPVLIVNHSFLTHTLVTIFFHYHHSARDIFLHNYLEPKQSREMRKNVFAKCQEYLDVACCRNKTGEEMNGIELVDHRRVVNMADQEGTLYLNSQHGISSEKRSFSIKPGDFDPTAGHDISKFLRQNAETECRGKELVRIVKEILADDEHTKIIVFADGRIGAGNAARSYLEASGLGCTHLDVSDSVEAKNKKIAWYQRGDATEEDKKRPRVLVLHFEHAAGLNLQTECHNMILFSPLYIGEGGATSDPVSDASTEQQAIGRVFRPGQPNPVVNVFRIEVRGPEDEECLDGQIIRRNTDEETVQMAVNGGE